MLIWASIVLLFQFPPFNDFKDELGIILLLGLFISSLVIIQQMVKIFLLLPGKLPWVPAGIGICLTLLGLIFDVFSAIIQALDWDRKIYTVDKLMLDLGFTLKQIYYLGFIGQMLLVVVTALLWMLFLKAYPLLLRRIAGRSIWQVAMALFLGPKAFVSSMAPFFMAFSLYRCYLGLACLGLLPKTELASLVIYCGVFLIYIYTTYRQAQIVRLANA